MQKTVLKYIFNVALVLLILHSASCSRNGKILNAREYKQQKKYVQAVLLYDEFIERNQLSAEKTIAELERSDCYYELGLEAYNKNEYEIARNYLFLSNSDNADKLLDDVLMEQASIANKAGDSQQELQEYQYIRDYIPSSPLIPQVMLSQIKLYIESGNNIQAYSTFKDLVNGYRDNAETAEAVQLIDPILPNLMQETFAKKEAGNYSEAIEEYQMYLKCPSDYHDEIRAEIAESYLLWGIQEKRNGDFAAMNEYFGEAEKHDSNIISRTNREREEICSIFISDGDELRKQFKFDEAIAEYQKCFQVVPSHQKAIAQINSIDEQRQDIARADDLLRQASRQESSENYSEAKKLYQESYNLSKRPEIKDDINRMDTFIEIEKDPLEFALKVVREYKNGTIPRNVDKTFNDLEKQHPNQATISEWKAIYSFGEFKYEVRIDLLSPTRNYYFAWRVNLLTKKIDPLNKVSENMMENS